MSRSKKIISASIIFFLILSIILFNGCSKKKDDLSTKEAAVTVKVQDISLKTIDDIAKFTGRIEAEDDVKVVGKISGRVARFDKEVGDYVEEGEPIITLETSELQAQLGQAQAALAMAQANLNANEGGALPQQLEQARAAKEQAEANYANAKADYERMKALFEEDAISKQTFDGITLKYQVAKSQYETAQAQYNLTQQRLPKNIEALRAQVSQAQAAVDLINTNIENSIIKAPVSGIIASKLIQPGELAGAGQPLATVVNIENVKVVVDVSEDVVNKVKEGQEVDVVIGALDNKKMKGKISIVSPTSSQTGLFQLKVTIDNPDKELKPGMFAEVEIKTGQKKNAVVLPKDAILIKKHGNIVYTVEKGKAVEKLVKLGISNGKNVEVVKGLKKGDKVVVQGQNLLKDGSKVKVKSK
jgi:HlyD family secretion protein